VRDRLRFHCDWFKDFISLVCDAVLFGR